MLPERVKLHMA